MDEKYGGLKAILSVKPCKTHMSIAHQGWRYRVIQGHIFVLDSITQASPGTN